MDLGSMHQCRQAVLDPGFGEDRGYLYPFVDAAAAQLFKVLVSGRTHSEERPRRSGSHVG